VDNGTVFAMNYGVVLLFLGFLGVLVMSDLKKDLDAVTFPASKQDLVIVAEANDADSDILDELERLPDVDFESIEDVEAAMASKKGFSDPQKGAQRRSKVEEKKKEMKEKTGKLTEPGKTIAGEPDHRLLENETEAIHAARHMEHGYDGRGEVKTPEMDARLKENRAEEPRPSRKRQTWKEYSQK
jgi:Protein of unknown function (DUF2795)